MPNIVIQLSSPSILHLFAGLLYLLLAAYFGYTRWYQCASVGRSLPVEGEAKWSGWLSVVRGKYEKFLLGIALILHGLSLSLDIYQGVDMYFSFALALALMMWFAVLVYWLGSFFVNTDGLQPFILLVAACCALLPIFVSKNLIAYSGSIKLQIHFFLAMSAYSLFALAAIYAVGIRFFEWLLHQRQGLSMFSELPPLLSVELLLFRILMAGFVLLSLALLTGLLFAEDVFGQALRFDHKTLFAFVSWGIFAVLLFGRQFYGWRGRKALNLILSGFAALLLTYIGTHFVLEIILDRV